MSRIPQYSALETLIQQRSNLYKRASDGLHSEVPDDPTGDGTVEPSTGDLFAEMDKELEDYPIVDVTAMDEGAAYDSNVKSNLDNIGTEVTEFDDAVVDEYNTEVEDPGTESQVKASSARYAHLTFAQNQRLFQKAASRLMADARERAGVGTYVKQASAINNTEAAALNRTDKARAIIDEAERDAILFAKHAAYVLRKNASGEEVSDEDVPDEDILETAPDTSSSSEDMAVVDAPSDAEVLAELPPEVVETLAEMPEEELEVIEELASAVDAGVIEPEEAMAAISGEAPAAEIPAEALEDATIIECTEDGCTPKEARYRRSKRAAARRTLMRKLARRRLMRKLAEEAPITEADIAAASELPTEDLAAVEALAPEAVDQLIALEEAVQSGEIPPEVAVDLLEGDPELEAALEETAVAPDAPITEEEAAAELSSAMADEGVTPEDLEAIATESVPVKAAHLRNIARGVRAYRVKHAAYKRSKTARSAAIRRRCKSVLNELTTN